VTFKFYEIEALWRKFEEEKINYDERDNDVIIKPFSNIIEDLGEIQRDNENSKFEYKL
jgi:hypothetical protein